MPREVNGETYLTLKEAAMDLGLSMSTILHLADMDILPSYGPGERRFASFKKSDIDSLATENGALNRRRRMIYRSSAIWWARDLLSQPDWAIIECASHHEPVTGHRVLTELAIVSPQAEILFCELINPGIEGFHTSEVKASSFATARIREEVWPEILEITGQFDRLVDHGDSLPWIYTGKRLEGLKKKWEDIGRHYYYYDFGSDKRRSYLEVYRHRIMLGTLTGARADALAGLACIKDMATTELDPDPAPDNQ